MDIEQEFLHYAKHRSAGVDVSHKVLAIMNENESKLLDKRKRLDCVLTGESECLSQELNKLKMNAVENYLEERKNRALSSLIDIESKRKEVAKCKLELYMRENNEEIKINEAVQKCFEVASCNKYQIKENQKMKSLKQQMENTLDEILQQHSMKQVEREHANICKKTEEIIYHSAVLKNQILERRLKIEETMKSVLEEYKYLKQLAKQCEEDEKHEMLEKLKAKQCLAKEKYENMTESLEIKNMKRMLEKNNSDHGLLIGYSVTKNDKRQLRVEQELFIEAQQNFKEQSRMADIQAEELRKLEIKRQEEKAMKAKLEVDILKKQQNKDVLQTQMFQMIGMKKRNGF